MTAKPPVAYSKTVGTTAHPSRPLKVNSQSVSMEVDGLNAPRAIEPHRGDGAEKMDGQSPAGTQHGAHDVRSADREAGDLRRAVREMAAALVKQADALAKNAPDKAASG